MRALKSAALAVVGLLGLANVSRAADPIPAEFRDPETGARIVHVSRVPNDRSGVIYFTQGTATGDSRQVLFHTQTPDKWRYLYAFDLQTQAIKPLVTDRRTYGQDISPRTGDVYYQAGGAVWSVNIDRPVPRKIADLPADWSDGAGLSVNADATLVAGSAEIKPPATQPGATQPAAPESADPESAAAATSAPATGPKDEAPETKRLKAMAGTFAAHRPNLLFTVDLKTGAVKVIHRIDTWLGHVQFSPTDPSLLMYCHEGPWEKVDRIWTLRLPDGVPEIAYKRVEPREIAGHEVWSPDGQTIWFQDSVKGKKESYLASKNVVTGVLTKYRQPAGGGGIHQFQSPDGRFFIGDGGGKTATGPGKYMTLQEPDGDTLKVTTLCSLQKNDYAQCEPNPHLTPDQHWLVFTATFSGTPQAWAMEMPEKYWRK